MQRKSKTSDEGWLLSYADLITNLLIFFVMLLSASAMSKAKFQQIAKQMSGKDSPESLESIKKTIDRRIEDMGLQKLVRTDLGDDGLKVSVNSGIMFDVGSSLIRSEWEETLAKVLSGIAPYSSRYNFAVEGHTDARPLVRAGRAANGRPYTNWELSSERAMEVRRRLESAGVPANKIRVESYGETKPLSEAELAGLNEDEKSARLRRVVVRIH